MKHRMSGQALFEAAALAACIAMLLGATVMILHAAGVQRAVLDHSQGAASSANPEAGAGSRPPGGAGGAGAARDLTRAARSADARG